MVHLIDFGKLSDGEKALALFLQGVLARKGVKIFVDADNYLSYLDEEGEYADVYGLIGTYAGKFSGAVVYDLSCTDVSVNMAATLAAAYDVLCVPRALINKVNAAGIETVGDLAEVGGTPAAAQRAVWNRVKDRLSKTAVVHQVVREGNFHIRLYDFPIANRWACIYTGESAEDRAFRREVLEYADKNIPVYGWNDDEIAFIKDISAYGDYAVPCDWSLNHSYFGVTKGKLSQRAKPAPVAGGKHYAAIVVSDGDNVQWLERDFSTTSLYGQRQTSGADYKMSWTFAPSLARLCSAAAKRIYSGNKHDYFVCGVSGIGYANSMSYPMEHLEEFTRMTSEGMEDCGLNVVTLLDNIKDVENCKDLHKRLHFYSKHDNIYGGIWELDPDRYSSGRGRIFWSDDKPFVSVRFTMWHESGRQGACDREWIEQFAAKVNAMKADPAHAEGYSVINIHPWTMSMENVDRFVSLLGGHIELVYADELIGMIKRNVKR